MSYDVPFIRPNFPDSRLVAADFDEIQESNWFTNFGPKERSFSNRIAGFVGDGTHAITVANATLGLIALIHVRLGRGDGTRGVVVPSFTFAAGPEAIEWCGYRPVFIDIEVDSLQPSLAGARAAVEKIDVAGILLCNSFGIGNAEIHEWEDWARGAGLPLLIDSAAGFGSAYPDGRLLGSAGDAEVFSFHATKPFAIGEGGAIVTRDAALVEQLRSFQNFGFGPERRVASLGLNAKLPELSAAIGLRQFQGFEDRLERRRAVVARYRCLLGPEWRMPAFAELSSVCFATVVAPDVRAREEALNRLESAGIEARRYYDPIVTDQPHFVSSEIVGRLPITREITSRVMSLPVHDHMSDAIVDRIAATVSGRRVDVGSR